jgi:hypothetical protein
MPRDLISTLRARVRVALEPGAEWRFARRMSARSRSMRRFGCAAAKRSLVGSGAPLSRRRHGSSSTPR